MVREWKFMHYSIEVARMFDVSRVTLNCLRLSGASVKVLLIIADADGHHTSLCMVTSELTDKFYIWY